MRAAARRWWLGPVSARVEKPSPIQSFPPRLTSDRSAPLSGRLNGTCDFPKADIAHGVAERKPVTSAFMFESPLSIRIEVDHHAVQSWIAAELGLRTNAIL